VQAIGILDPAVAYVRAVIHVGNQHILDPAVDLRLRLLHRRPGADDDQDDSGSSGHQPLAVYLLHVFDVHFVLGRLLEDD